MTLTPTSPSSSSPSLESTSIGALRDLRSSTCNPVGAPTVTADLSENIILTSLDDLHNWARLSSLLAPALRHGLLLH
jgi:NAD(P)H-quinone oxidoreductase subunit K